MKSGTVCESRVGYSRAIRISSHIFMQARLQAILAVQRKSQKGLLVKEKLISLALGHEVLEDITGRSRRSWKGRHRSINQWTSRELA